MSLKERLLDQVQKIIKPTTATPRTTQNLLEQYIEAEINVPKVKSATQLKPPAILKIRRVAGRYDITVGSSSRDAY